MTSSPAICLKCGAEALGKYCSQCGEPLRAVCKACGTEAPPRSRFCPECGASFKGATAKKTPVASSSRNALVTPWTVAGGIGVVLAAVGAFLMLDQKSTPPPSSSAPAASRATTAPPDISSLSPGEAAERLFNRIMTAAERDDLGEAERFVPMALQAYGQLGELDNDGHYHVGLLHVTVGDTDSAQAELDVIRQSVPNHLLGIQLEHAIAQALGDEDQERQAYRSFLDAYDAEIATGRDEYRGHRGGIDSFRDRAAEAIP